MSIGDLFIRYAEEADLAKVAIVHSQEGLDRIEMGYILMGAGALGLIVTMLLINQRSHTSHTSVEERRNINE